MQHVSSFKAAEYVLTLCDHSPLFNNLNSQSKESLLLNRRIVKMYVPVEEGRPLNKHGIT